MVALLVLLGIGTAGAADSTAPASAPAPRTVVYLGATLIDGDPTVARRNMAIVTRGDQIVGVQSADGFRPAGGEDVVDTRGRFIIPGLINTHVHLATQANPSRAKAYLRREVYSGVTTVRDMAGDVRLLAELKREAQFDEIAAPDIYYVALFAGPEFFADPRTHDAARGSIAGEVPWMRAITPQTDLTVAVAEARGTGATAIKIYADLPASLVRAITAEAHRQGLLVWAHAAVFPAQPRDVIDAGVDVISHSCMLGYQLDSTPVSNYHNRRPVDAAAVRQPSTVMDALWADLKRRGTILDATMYAFDLYPGGSCPAGLEDYLTAQAYRAGIPISAGTDDDPDWKDQYSPLDTELALLVHKAGETPADAIRSATVIAARTVGQDKALGTIQAGKTANFLVLKRNPLEDIGNVKSVSFVVKHGIRYRRVDYKPVTAEEVKEGTP